MAIEDDIKKALGEDKKEFPKLDPAFMKRIEDEILPTMKGLSIYELHFVALALLSMSITSQDTASSGMKVAQWFVSQMTDGAYAALMGRFGEKEVIEATQAFLIEKIQKGESNE